MNYHFGLVNMNRRSLARSGESNGRLYDPTIGRFLSPDNYVQEPGNSQSFNRYGYCLNNPLKNIDPNGELFGIDDVALAIVGLGLVNSRIYAAYGVRVPSDGRLFMGWARQWKAR